MKRKIIKTPAPWAAKLERISRREQFRYSITAADGTPVAELGYKCGSTVENAPLIAAAPELLAALESALAEMEAGMDEGHPSVKAAKDKARAAIAKAKGE